MAENDETLENDHPLSNAQKHDLITRAIVTAAEAITFGADMRPGDMLICMAQSLTEIVLRSAQGGQELAALEHATTLAKRLLVAHLAARELMDTESEGTA